MALTSHQSIALALRARLDELTRRVGELEAELREPLDADFAEQAAALQDDEPIAALESAGRDEIDRIRAALARIDDGSYGTCATCGEDIVPARLVAVPTAVQCAGCAGATRSHRA